MLLNLGNPETWEPEVMGEPTGEGLMMRPRARPEGLEPIENSINISDTLMVSRGSRVDFPPGTDGLMNISLDFNSAPNAKGVEIIIPDDSSAEVVAAAKAYVNAVKEFADANGYGGYKIRTGGKIGPGIFTTSENKERRDDGLGGVSNTIHTEPFFTQDAKMEKIVSENFSDFAKIYTDVFKDLNARIVIPHGTKGNPTGAASKVFGSEYEYGKRLIDELLGY